MKKIYSIVLMATALLIGTNVNAADVTVQGNDLAALKAAIAATGANGGKVTLTQPIVITADNQNSTSTSATATTWAGIWIGTEAEDGAAQSITLDLAGNDITIQTGDCKNKNGVSIAQVIIPFVITKGTLNVTGSGTIKVQKGTSPVAAGTNVFAVFGTYNKVDPKGANPFSHLFIDENVNVLTANGTVIAVDALRSAGLNTAGNATYGSKNTAVVSPMAAMTAIATSYGTKPAYSTDYFNSSYGFAFGALVEVKGTLSSLGVDATKCYGIKTNGYLAYPGGNPKTKTGADILPRSGDKKYDWMDGYSVDENDAKYAPFIHVYPSAKLRTSNEKLSDASAAAYCSGYAQWKVEGTCDGATGLYASSGNIDIENATITSGADWYDAPGGTGHADGGGSAIVINSREAYAGSVEIEISGDTEVSAKSGYAIEEAVNTTVTHDDVTGKDTQETKLENLSITGGSFQGGTNPVSHEQQPAIIISNPTASDDVAEVVVYGGNIEGPVVVNGDDSKSLDDFLDGEVHTTIVVVDGKNVTVVSEGAAPTGSATVSDQEGKSVKWTGDAENIAADLQLKELEINENKAQVLTVKAGKKLNIGRVVLGEKAQIIVEAGATFIVSGEQGFVAPVASNIILKNEEGNPSIFLFNPKVNSNRHPDATVEFVSRSYTVSSSDYAFQRFGIPTIAGGLESIETKYNNADVATGFMAYDYAIDDWAPIGYINASGKTPLDIAKLAKPFEYYQMQHNTPNMGTVVTMKGKLVGNEISAVPMRDGTWNGYANSCTGLMSMKNVITTANQAIYLNNIQAHQKVWESYSLLNVLFADQYIYPLQPFLINNDGAAADLLIDYADAVYYTPVGSGESKPNSAPVRTREFNDITIASMLVSGENGYDRVIVAEDAQFSAEFDNGVDAVKYMNDGVNMYVSADEKMSNFATDNLDNTYVGVDANGTYTIKFANVMGEELTLIDNETGAHVAMVEGNVYEFIASGKNDYRFEIVKTNKVATSIENTEAVKSAKGVYTITGQYMGEMNVWNSLPAGVYVVNGEKRVK